MSRLTELLRQARKVDPQLGADLEAEIAALTKRRTFGLVFEQHQPEVVELPGRPVRRGDKVRVLPSRGETNAGDQRLWRVSRIERIDLQRLAHLALLDVEEPEIRSVPADDVVVVAEFRDRIYPGLVETGRVERGGDKPFHSVINAENYHALEMLTYTHRHSIDVIYIDPPYNTGAKDWKYNNDYVEGDDDYRHSKWLAFMERRLKIARELLNPEDSVLIVTIDEKEYLRLGLLLEQTFPEARIQMVSSQINPAVVARAGQFGRQDEYIYVVAFGAATPQRTELAREWVSAKGRTHTGKVRWDLLKRSGTNSTRNDRPGLFYPVYIDPEVPRIVDIGEPIPLGDSEVPAVEGAVTLLPIRQDGTEGNWQWSPSSLRSRMAKGRVRVGGNAKRGFTIYILKDGEYAKVMRGEFEVSGRGEDGSLQVVKRESDTVVALPGTQWRIASHDSTQYGSRLLSRFLPDRRFPFPKSLYAVEDVLRFFVKDNPEAVVLDFFSGSGTTAHAVMRLNRQDGGRRQCISVTNNEVSADEQAGLRRRGLRPGDGEWEALGICDHITKPRLTAAITGRTPQAEEIKGDYKFTGEFPMSEGLEENAAFFTLTYEASLSVRHNRAFERVAPILWLRAGSYGRVIYSLGATGWDVAESYAVLENLDQAEEYVVAVRAQESIKIAYVVTDDDSAFQMVCRELPSEVVPVQLYESYLQNFEINTGRSL